IGRGPALDAEKAAGAADMAAEGENAPAAFPGGPDGRSDAEHAVALLAAYRAGRISGLAVPRDAARAELFIWRDWRIHGYSVARYSAQSIRTKAALIHVDMARHPDIRAKLGGEVLSAGQIYRILRGERSGSRRGL